MRIVTLFLAISALFLSQSAKAQCEGVNATFVLQTGQWAFEIDFDIVNDSGVVIYSLENLTSNPQNYTTYTGELCLPVGCYILNQYDGFGDGWNGGSITLSYDSTMVSLPGLADGEFGSVGFGIYTDGCGGGSTGNQIPGCTDPSAINYQPWATVDNGSCQYSQECEEGVLVSLYICTFSNGNQVQLELFGENGDLLFEASNLGNAAIEYFELCLPPGECLNALMSNTTGPNGWYNGYFWVNYNGNQVVTGSLQPGQQFGEVAFSLSGTACPYGGCTDQDALNFDAGASFDDGSCAYPIDCTGLNAVTATLWSASPQNQILWYLTDETSEMVASGANNFGAAFAMDTLCLADGCYTLYLQSSGGPNAPGGSLILETNGFSGVYQLLPGDNIGGGLGENSMAYVVSINSECEELAYGCTDAAATNYDPEAQFNDGSCTYPAPDNDLCANATALVPGMQLISNVNAFQNENVWGQCWAFGSGEGEQTSVWFTFTTPADSASIHIEAIADGTNTLTDTQFGLFTECGGEMIYCDGNSGQGLLSAFTFGCGELAPNTTYILMVDGYFGDMGTCYLNYEVNECIPVMGCTDASALNYNPEATQDDGSCEFPGPCTANEVIMIISTQAWGYEVSWALIAADGTVAAEGAAYNNYAVMTELLCIEDGCYTIELYDSFGDGWNGGSFILQSANGGNYASGTLASGDFASMPVAINSECEGAEIAGCTDPSALNYNPSATEDDGSCLYSQNGPSVNGIFDPMEVDLYPNPAEGNVNLDIFNGNGDEAMSVHVFDLQGRVVFTRDFGLDQERLRVTFDANQFPAGVYLVQVLNGHERHIERLVRQ
jgi:hypothetical protein